MILRFKEIFKSYKIKIVVITILSVIGILVGTFLPYLNGKFIDILVKGTDFNNIVYFSMSILVLGIINIITSYFIRYNKSLLVEHIKYNIKMKILDHLRYIPLLEFNKYKTSYLNQRIDQDVNIVVNFILDNFSVFFINLIKFIIIMVLLFEININISIISIGFIILYLIIYIKFKKDIFLKSIHIKEQQNTIFNIFNEQLELMEEIKIQSNFSQHDLYILNNFKTYFSSFINYIKTMTTFSSIEVFFSYVFQVTIFLFGGYEVINSKMSIGQLTMISTYFGLLLQVMKYYYEFSEKYQITKASNIRLIELENLEKEQCGTRVINSIKHIKGNIFYKYPGTKTNIFRLKDIKINKGELVGIVGHNGVGKTTITKLIIGILNGKNQEHSILYNDIDLKNLNMIDIRKNYISYISQYAKMTNKTVSNIFKEIKADINLENLENYYQYIKGNQRKKIIMFLSNMWNCNINKISGGEKQIISILRGLLKEPQLIIFDEPTSNLDKSKTLWFRELLFEIKDNRLVVVITHDEELISYFDKKIVVDNVE